MNGFAASRPPATISSFGFTAPPRDEVPAALGRLGLDHHDRDVAVVEHAAGDHQVEHCLVDLLRVRERDPLVLVLEPKPGMSARRTPAIGPENGRPEIWVDAEAALIASAS